MSISLVLADAHPILLEGLADVFRSEEDLEVLAACGDGVEALKSVRLHRPDIVVLDMRMPELSGLEVARQIKKEELPTRAVLLTGALEDEETIEALRIGVQGIFLKGMAVHLLIQCMRKVYAGERWVEHTSAMQALERMLRREKGTREFREVLTTREMQIVDKVTCGLRNKEIASSLCVSEGTVKVHLHNIYDKIKVEGRMALLRHAQEKGLV